MKLSVIILNYNVRYFLEQCILSVQQALQGLDAEIIVIDNNSVDGSCDMVSEKFPQITLISNKENVGFSKANNQGVAIAKGEYVCILNPDTAVSEDTFYKVLAFAERQENPGAVGVKLIDGTGNFLPESKRNIPTPKVSYYKLTGKQNNKYSYYADHVHENEIAEVSVLVGAFMLMKKTVYQEVGGFDEDYFMYGEDIDLSYKLIKANYKNYYSGETTVLHYKGESTTKDKVYFNRFYGAMKIFYKKHFHLNIFIKWMVGTGVFLSKKRHSFKTISDIESPLPNAFYVISKDAAWIQKLSETQNNTYQIVTESELRNKVFHNCRIVFDTDAVSYNSIFATIQKLNNMGNTFRIKPKNASYIIGSDTSVSKGEVSFL